jgi:hypothetical protein
MTTGRGRERFDSRSFRALSFAFLLMDLRSQHYAHATGSRHGDLIPPLFWVIGQFVLATGIVSTALFCRIDLWAFAFTNLSVSMFLVATAVIVEFHELVAAPDDPEIIGHLGLSRTTYAAARASNLGVFVLLVTVSSNIFPAILGCGFRESSLHFLPGYVLACLIGNLGTAALVSLLYTPWSRADTSGVRDALAWSQIILILASFYGAQWMFRDSRHSLLGLLASPPDYVEWLPSALLADLAVSGVPTASHGSALQTAITGLMVTLLLCLWLVLRIAAMKPAGVLDFGETSSQGQRSLVGPVSRWLARTPGDAALIGLAFAMLRRDHDLRMRVLPSLVTVPAILLLGVATDQLGNTVFGEPSRAVLPLTAVILVTGSVPAMLHAMSFSRHEACSWIVLSTTGGRERAPAEAARVAICAAVALPAMVLSGLMFAIVWKDPLAALIQVLLGGLQILIASHVTTMVLRHEVPFSRPLARGDILGSIAPCWAAVVTCAALVGALQVWAHGDALRLTGVGALLLALYFAARKAAA